MRIKKIYFCQFNSAEEIIAKQILEEIHYDQSGNILTYIQFDQDGMMVQKVTRAYTPFNAILSDRTEYAGHDSVELQVNTYAGENLMQSTLSFHDEYQGMTQYEYDKKDRLILEKSFDENNEVISTQTHKYDDDKAQVEVIETDEDGEISWKIVRQFDSKKQVVREQETHYFEGGEKSLLTTFSYTSSGETKSIHEYDDEDNLVLKIVNEIDDKGRVVSEITYENEKETVMTFSYDDAGNETSFETYVNDELIEVRNFDFDEQHRVIASRQYQKASKEFFHLTGTVTTYID